MALVQRIDTENQLTSANAILARPKLPYEDPILNPNYVKPDDPTFQSQGLVGYRDKYGRTAVTQGNRDTGQVARAPGLMDKAVPQPVAPIGPVTPPSTPTDTTNKGEPIVPDDPGTPQQTLFNMGTLGTLLGIGSIASGVYSMAVNDMANTGIGAGVFNAVDAFGYNNLGEGFTYAGTDGVVIEAGKTTLSNAIGYGMFGGFTAGLLGLSSDNMVIDTLAGAIGGAVGGYVAGTATTTAVGQALGSYLGPIGAFLGGFAMTALVSAFGPRPSDQLAGGLYDFEQGSVTNTWTFQGKKYNSKNNSNRDTFFGYVGTLNDQLSSQFGGTTTLKNIRLDLGRHTGVGIRMNSGLGDEDTGADMGDGKKALEFIGKEILRTSTYDNQDIAYVQQNTDWTKADFGTTSSAYAFAKDFRAVSSAMLTGQLNLDTSYEEGMSIVDTWETRANNMFANDPERLGLVSASANTLRTKLSSQRSA